MLRYLPKKLVHFRKNKFRLAGKEIIVAGMGGPHNNSLMTPKLALQLLKEKYEMDVVIGLHEEKNFTAEATEVGLKYHYMFVNDHTRIKPKIFNKIYEIVKKASDEGKKVTIHCGGGMARTGAALASLKLRELIEQEYKEDPTMLTRPVALSEYEYLDGFSWQRGVFVKNDLRGSPLVMRAIRAIRNECFECSDSNTGKNSIEIQTDVDSLMEYEAYLKQQLYLALYPPALRETLYDPNDLDYITDDAYQKAIETYGEKVTAIAELLNAIAKLPCDRSYHYLLHDISQKLYAGSFTQEMIEPVLDILRVMRSGEQSQATDSHFKNTAQFFDQYCKALTILKLTVSKLNGSLKGEYNDLIMSADKIKNEIYLKMVCYHIRNNHLETLTELQRLYPDAFAEVIKNTNASPSPLLCIAADSTSYECYAFLLSQGATEQGSLGVDVNSLVSKVPDGYIKMLNISKSRSILADEKKLSIAIACKIDLTNKLNELISAINADTFGNTVQQTIIRFMPSSQPENAFGITIVPPTKNENLISIAKKLIELIKRFPYADIHMPPITFTQEEMYLLSPANFAAKSKFEKDLFHYFNGCIDQHLIYPTSGVDYRIVSQEPGGGGDMVKYTKGIGFEENTLTPYGRQIKFSFATIFDPGLDSRKLDSPEMKRFKSIESKVLENIQVTNKVEVPHSKHSNQT